MPLYTFQNTNTGELSDHFFKISERPETLEINGEIHIRVMSAPAIVSGVGGLKVDSLLKHRLTEIKKQHPEMKASAI